MKQLHKCITRREDGASTYMATMLSVFVIVVLFLVLFLNYAQITTQNKVERAYRKYLLRMETEGYLSRAAKGEMVSELTTLGLKNINLSGSSEAPVGYGGEIVLRIEGDLSVEQIHFTAGKGARAKEDIHIVIEKSGTALY